MPHHPRALRGFVGALTLLLATGASAKGQLSAGGAVNHYESAADRVEAEVVQSANRICASPTADECESAAYASTRCGGFEADRIWRGLSSSCAATCPSPTLSLCADDSHHRSLCGALDAYRRSLAGAHAGLEGEGCSLAPGTCADILCQWAEGEQSTTGSLVAGAPVGPVVRAASTAPDTGDATRDRLALEANGFANPDDIVETPLLESDYASFRPQGAGAHYWSRMLFDQALFVGPATIANPTFIALRNVWADEREQWDVNGTTFDSCQEYVYEKYYDYSLFEDATRRPGIDFREVFDLAFAGEVGGEHPRSAIGTRALSGLPLRMKDGTPLDVELNFATGVPQNRFFSFEMIEPSARADAIERWEANDRRYVVSVAGEEVSITTTRPLFQAGDGLGVRLVGFPFAPGPDEDELYGRLRQRRLHDESFAWHKAASEHLADTPDEVLYLYDRLKDELATLLERRRAVEAEIAALGRIVGDEGMGFILVDRQPFDPRDVINPFESIYTPADQVIVDQRTFVHDERALVGQVVAPERLLGGSATLGGQNLLGQGAAGMQTRSSSTSGSVTMKNPSVGGSLGFLRGVAGTKDGGLGFAGGGVASGLTQKDTVASRVAGLFRELVAVDEEIEVALRYARSVGCLDPTPPLAPIGAVNACDWSPRDFAEAVEDQLLWQREHDHKRCVELTGDDFESLRISEDVPARFSAEINPPTDAAAFPFYPYGPQGILCDDGPYNESVEWFERYRGCIDAWRVLLQRNIARYFTFLQELLEGATDLIDPITGDVRPNQETSDSGGFGDDTFGAGYDYSAGWSMTLPPESDPPSELFCNTAPNVWAHFDASARIFGAEADIVAASLEAGLGPGATNRASLEILGASLIDVERTATLDAARYNVIFEESTGEYDEYFHASATFMVGPVPVTVTAGAGGLIAASVSARGGDSPRGDGCQNGDLAIEGTFMPSYSLIGFASAGVDALIVEAGVKIELVIVSLGFPYTLTLELDGRTTNGQPDAKVTLTNDLDMRLSLLGGRVAAYVEVCFILCEEWDFTIFQWAPTVLSKNLFHSTIDFSMKGIFAAREKLPVQTFPGAQP